MRKTIRLNAEISHAISHFYFWREAFVARISLPTSTRTHNMSESIAKSFNTTRSPGQAKTRTLVGNWYEDELWVRRKTEAVLCSNFMPRLKVRRRRIGV